MKLSFLLGSSRVARTSSSGCDTAVGTKRSRHGIGQTESSTSKLGVFRGACRTPKYSKWRAFRGYSRNTRVALMKRPASAVIHTQVASIASTTSTSSQSGYSCMYLKEREKEDPHQFRESWFPLRPRRGCAPPGSGFACSREGPEPRHEPWQPPCISAEFGSERPKECHTIAQPR